MSKILKGEYFFTGANGIEVGPFPLTVVPEASCTTQARKSFIKQAKLRNRSNNGIVEVTFPSAGVQVKACNVEQVTEAFSLS